jgi:hypothetical protein
LFKDIDDEVLASIELKLYLPLLANTLVNVGFIVVVLVELTEIDELAIGVVAVVVMTSAVVETFCKPTV